MSSKVRKLESMADKLDAFCQETGNIKLAIKKLMEETDRLRKECITNENETKRLRRIVMGHADISLQLMERSFTQAPARSSSPVGRRGTADVLSVSGPQPASKNQVRNYRNKCKMKKERILPQS